MRFCADAYFYCLLSCLSLHPFRISFYILYNSFNSRTEFQTEIVFLNIFLHFIIFCGIQLTIPDDSLADVNPEYKKGAVVDITGETAEQFVRYRDIDKTQSALVRQERQKTFLQALVQKAQEKAGEDAGFVTGLYDSVKSYTVTNMGNDIFAKLLAASQNGITDTETVPGEGTHGENFDEYHIDEDALSDLIISMFYEKI